jgi:hypothetical protein
MGRRQRESEFQDLSHEEVARRARDKGRPPATRRRYQREEKFRGLRATRKTNDAREPPQKKYKPPQRK